MDAPAPKTCTAHYQVQIEIQVDPLACPCTLATHLLPASLPLMRQSVPCLTATRCLPSTNLRM